MSRHVFVRKMVELGLTAPLASHMLAYAGVAVAQTKSDYKPTKGTNVTALDKSVLRALCGDMQIVFQYPYASLNPRMRVGAIIGEALIIHGLTRETGGSLRIASLSSWRRSGCMPITCAAIPMSS